MAQTWVRVRMRAAALRRPWSRASWIAGGGSDPGLAYSRASLTSDNHTGDRPIASYRRSLSLSVAEPLGR